MALRRTILVTGLNLRTPVQPMPVMLSSGGIRSLKRTIRKGGKQIRATTRVALRTAKEVWYLTQAETKSHIATFALQEREDGQWCSHQTSG